MQKTKVILITGAAKRLGAGLVRYFHQQGYNVILHYNLSKSAALELSAELNTLRANSIYLLSADFNQLTNYQEFIQEAYNAWGRLDGIINNASSFYPTKFGEITEKQWDDLFATNAKTPLFLSQAAFPYLKKTEGCIVNIIDIYGKKPLRHYSTYSMAKASLWMLTLALAQECAPYVRVNGIAPGTFIWPEGINQLSEAKKQSLIEKIPLQKQGSINDIATAIDYFFSATFVTGQVLGIDGGRSIKF